MNDEYDLAEDFKVNQQDTENKQESYNAERIPARTEAGWSDYLMSKLTEKELWKQYNDGKITGTYPKVSGLRRLTLAYLGTIVFSGIKTFVPPNLSIQNGRLLQQYATVVYEVSVKLHGNDNGNPLIITYSEIADAHPEFNLDKVVAGHPSPMAATRAEARALRKMLGLDVAAAEEIQGGGKDVVELIKSKDTIIENATDQEAIQPDQINVIKKMTTKLNIDLSTLVSGNIKNLTRQEAQELCADLAKWNKENSVPKQFLKGEK